MKKPSYIDLFAGAGGLSEGFITAGFRPVAHVEMELAACNTLKTRTAFHYLKSIRGLDVYSRYLKGDIKRETLYALIPNREMDKIINLELSNKSNGKIFERIDKLLGNDQVDLVIGGPPCQAYSLIGRARSKSGMNGDPRNYLYLQYTKYLKRYNPKMFVFENVLGLRSAGGGKYFDDMKATFKSVGYELEDLLFKASDYGVLQNRKRIVLIGYRKDIDLSNLHFKHHFNSIHKVSSILCDLPKLQAGQGKDKNAKYKSKANSYLINSSIRNGLDVLTQHVTRPHTAQDKEIYRIAVQQLKGGSRLNYTSLPVRLKSHNNQHSFFDRFKVVDDNAHFAQTVVAHIAKDGHYYIHPDLKQNRSLSVREAARLQSFPDDYYFEGIKEGKNRTAAFKQIGNAVPPLMAEMIARSIKKLIKK